MELDLRVSLKKLELFVLVAELGSVRRAAEQTFVTQPVVTAHMQDLGDRLGVELFAREGNRFGLTEQGGVVLEWAKATLASAYMLARHLQEAGDGTRGTATIAASMTIGSYVLPDVISRFIRDRPAASIAMSVFDLERVTQGVETGQHDFGVVIADDLDPSPVIFCDRLGFEELVLVGPPDTEPASAGRIRPTHVVRRPAPALAGLRLVASPQHTMRQDLVDRLLRLHGLKRPPIAVELGSAEAMKRAVRRGLGVSFLFRSSVADELSRGDLCELELPGVQLLAPVYLLRRSDRRWSPMQNALAEAVRAAIGVVPVQVPPVLG